MKLCSLPQQTHIVHCTQPVLRRRLGAQRRVACLEQAAVPRSGLTDLCLHAQLLCEWNCTFTKDASFRILRRIFNRRVAVQQKGCSCYITPAQVSTSGGLWVLPAPA